ncbi:MAG: hypothetical protein IT158_28200 [Bryobacterales bacterium]|nr:hypothetical protein [Bryobacterales bacterium]
MKRRLFLLYAAGPVLVLAKQGRSKGKRGRAAVRFQEAEIRVILDYYRTDGGLPPGLAKRAGDLPPGLETQLRRNGRLPPGLEKKLVPFPDGLSSRLGPLPAGYSRVTLGTKALLILTATRTVLDIIDLASR